MLFRHITNKNQYNADIIQKHTEKTKTIYTQLPVVSRVNHQLMGKAATFTATWPLSNMTLWSLYGDETSRSPLSARHDTARSKTSETGVTLCHETSRNVTTCHGTSRFTSGTAGYISDTPDYVSMPSQIMSYVRLRTPDYAGVRQTAGRRVREPDGAVTGAPSNSQSCRQAPSLARRQPRSSQTIHVRPLPGADPISTHAPGSLQMLELDRPGPAEFSGRLTACFRSQDKHAGCKVPALT